MAEQGPAELARGTKRVLAKDHTALEVSVQVVNRLARPLTNLLLPQR